VIDTQLAVAFSAGMLAAINPCGFAMLPAYLSYFLGLEDSSRDAQAGVLRAIKVGLAVSAGFMVVFALMGVLIVKFSVIVQPQLPYVTMVIGVGIVALGIAMLRGFEPTVSFLPKMNKGTSSRQLSSMFLFGISYAVSSLSCTIPVFMLNVANTFATTNFLSGFIVFLAYAFGMALVLMVLTLALALARQGLVQRLRHVLPHVNQISGALLVFAGLFLTYFGWYEVRVLNDSDPGGPASLLLQWNSDLSNWVNRTGPMRIGVVLLGVLVVTVLVATSWRSGRQTRSGPSASSARRTGSRSR
jgi:cytochrome c-type biogenesis protein